MAAAWLPPVRVSMPLQGVLVSYRQQPPVNIILDQRYLGDHGGRQRVSRANSSTQLDFPASGAGGRSVSSDLIGGDLPWSFCWNIALRYSSSCYRVAHWREAASTIILAASW